MAKSVTWKVGADTSDFTKGMNAAQRSITQTENQAKELQKGLQFEWNEQRFVKAQQLAQKALTDTEAKAQKIREQLKYLEQSDGINTAGYERLQTELIKTENKAVLLRNELEKVNNLKFDKAAQSATDLGNKLDSAAKKTKGLSVAAAGLLVTGAAVVNKTIEWGDEVQTLADKYDMSAESIQKFQYWALQSDVAADVMFNSVSKIRSAIGSQLVGETTAATDALEALGVKVKDFPDAESAFEATILQLAAMENKTLQAHYANEILGERLAKEFIPLLNQGAEGLAALTAEFEAVGFMSNETVAELAAADDMLNQLKTQFRLAAAEVGVALLPVLKSLVEFLQTSVIPVIKSFADWFSNLSPSMQNALLAVLVFTAALSPLLKVGGAVFKMIGSVIGVIPKLISLLKGVNLAAWQTYAGFAAIAGAVFLINDLFQNWGEMSTIEKILKTLAVAALIAAGAIMIFHASWSLGIAIGAIVAGIAAGTAAINAAGKSFGVETPNISTGGGNGSTPTPEFDPSDFDFDPSYGGGGSTSIGDTITDNSTVTINIYDAEQKQTSEIIEEINKYYTNKKLAFR